MHKLKELAKEDLKDITKTEKLNMQHLSMISHLKW
jgi:hypothetical protein